MLEAERRLSIAWIALPIAFNERCMNAYLIEAVSSLTFSIECETSWCASVRSDSGSISKSVTLCMSVAFRLVFGVGWRYRYGAPKFRAISIFGRCRQYRFRGQQKSFHCFTWLVLRPIFALFFEKTALYAKGLFHLS
jgi:hypothetical protein